MKYQFIHFMHDVVCEKQYRVTLMHIILCELCALIDSPILTFSFISYSGNRLERFTLLEINHCNLFQVAII